MTPRVRGQFGSIGYMSNDIYRVWDGDEDEITIRRGNIILIRKMHDASTCH